MNNRDNLLYFILILAVILMLNEHHVLTLAEPFKGVVNSLMQACWGMYWGIEWIMKSVKKLK